MRESGTDTAAKAEMQKMLVALVAQQMKRGDKKVSDKEVLKELAARLGEHGLSETTQTVDYLDLLTKVAECNQ